MSRVDLLTPVGRLVRGSLYKPNERDAEGKALVVKSGPNAGQPRKDFFFALAIPKGPEQHWAQTAWGQIIFNQGRIAFPQAHQSPQFAWKVKDGDSAVPNRAGKVPKDQPGHPGHWVLSFSSGYAPKIVRDGGAVPMPQPDAVNLGDFVQVFGSVDGNGSQQQPGMFLNHSMVCFAAHGERISVGLDATKVGFGQGVTLPPGASLTPLATMTPAVAAAVAAPAMPGMPTAPYGTQATGLLPAAPVVVAPNPAFLMPPPAAVVAPPAPPVRQMTAKASGATYEQLIANGWNDQLLVQHGLMVA